MAGRQLSKTPLQFYTIALKNSHTSLLIDQHLWSHSMQYVLQRFAIIEYLTIFSNSDMTAQARTRVAAVRIALVRDQVRQ